MQCLLAFWRLFVQRDSIARLQASQSKSSHNKVISDSLILYFNQIVMEIDQFFELYF